MAKKYIVEYDRINCIGAAACVASNPLFWELKEDGKANLVGGKKLDKNAKQTIEIDEKDLPKMKEAAEVCPVNVIHIIDKQTGKRII